MNNKMRFSPGKVAVGAAMLTSFLLSSKAALAQDLQAQDKQKSSTVVMNKLSISPASPLGVLQIQVKQFPKDIQDHFSACLNALYNQEEADAVNSLLAEHIFKNIQDPQEQAIRAFKCLEDGTLSARVYPTFTNWASSNLTQNQSNRQFKKIYISAYAQWLAANKMALLQEKDQKLKETQDKNIALDAKLKLLSEREAKSKEEGRKVAKEIDELLQQTLSPENVSKLTLTGDELCKARGFDIQKEFPTLWKNIKKNDHFLTNAQ